MPGDWRSRPPRRSFPVRRYWRIWRRFAGLSLAQLLEYRANVLLTLLEQLGQLAVLTVAYLVLYGYAEEVAGWTRDEALVLLGVWWTFDGLWTLLFARSVPALISLVRRGDLDFVLLRPASSQFLVTCWRGVDPRAAGKTLQGLLLTLYACRAAGVSWHPGNVLAAVALGLCGLAVLYALRFAVATCAFWVLQIGDLDDVVQTIADAARFPVAYFPQPVRALLTYAIPVAFAATFPAEALLGTSDPSRLPTGALLAAGALAGSSGLWRFAVRSYTSAGG